MNNFKRFAYCFVVIILILFFAFPVVFTLVGSFMSSSEINVSYGMVNGGTVDDTNYIVSEYGRVNLIPQSVTLKQYSSVLLMDSDYLLCFWNSIIYTIPIVIIQVIFSLFASYALYVMKGKISDILLVLYMIVCMLPYQVTLVPNFLVLNKMNLLDSIWSIWLPGFAAPFSVYMFSKYMKRIPLTIIEAAKIDGANEWKIFSKIVMPLCRSSIVSVAILVFLDYWNMVEQPIMFLYDDTKYPLSVFISSYNKDNIAIAFAAAVVYMVLPILFFLYGRDYLVEGISCQNGIKG